MPQVTARPAAALVAGRALNRPGLAASEAHVAASNVATNRATTATRMAKRYHSHVIDTRYLFAPLHAELLSLLRVWLHR